jgi:hypothetical protein
LDIHDGCEISDVSGFSARDDHPSKDLVDQMEVDLPHVGGLSARSFSNLDGIARGGAVVACPVVTYSLFEKIS